MYIKTEDKLKIETVDLAVSLSEPEYGSFLAIRASRIKLEGYEKLSPPLADKLTAILTAGFEDNPRIISKTTFYNRFTEEEKLKIYEIKQNTSFTNPAILNAVVKLFIADYIDLDNQDVISGFDVLIQAGFLTKERKAEVLA